MNKKKQLLAFTGSTTWARKFNSRWKAKCTRFRPYKMCKLLQSKRVLEFDNLMTAVTDDFHL